MNSENELTHQPLHEDWKLDFKFLRNECLTVARNHSTRQFQHLLWPMAKSYLNPLSPLFLTQVVVLELLNTKSQWFIRDGLLPLLFFFKKFPTPRGIKTSLLIDIEFSAFVPKSWKPLVKYYSLQIIEGPTIRERKNLLFVGVMWNGYTSLEYFEKILSKISFQPYDKIQIFCPTRARRGCHQEQVFHALFIQKFLEYAQQKKIKKENIEFISTQYFELNSDFSGHDIVDLNEKLFLADNFLLHRLLSKGARLLNGVAGDTKAELIPLSFRHGVRMHLASDNLGQKSDSYEAICLRLKNHKQLSPSFAESIFDELMEVPYIKTIPWKKWFSSWEMT